MEKRGQLSIEYLVLVGFTVSMLTVLILVQYQHNEEQNLVVVSNQADKITRSLVDAAEEIYYLGTPARTTIKTYMPTNIERILIVNHTIMFQMRTSHGLTDIEKYSSVNITGNISTSSGIKYIKVLAQPNSVCILEEGLTGC